MSLSLVQDYSSDEDKESLVGGSDDSSSQDERELFPVSRVLSPPSKGSTGSLLPSPEDLFLEVTGPPEFLKSAATEPICSRPRDNWEPSRDFPQTSIYSDRSHLVPDLAEVAPLGAVIEAKATSYDPHKEMKGGSEDGTNDTKGGAYMAPGVRVIVHGNATALSRPIITAENIATATETDKRNRSKIKDKEKNKRMKGQSSHATWKSETEMQLRQQFD